MEKIILILLVSFLITVTCKPLDDSDVHEIHYGHKHIVKKRFVDPESFGGFIDRGFTKMRTKRSSEEDCEKLQLCKLHASSSTNLFRSFQLYFVNKENARLWDHHSHTLADCHRRFSCYRR